MDRQCSTKNKDSGEKRNLSPEQNAEFISSGILKQDPIEKKE